MKSSKTRGFTLIELLAIIVILAIIAVITVPIILNVIENAKKGAAIDSAYGYKDAIEKYYVTKLSENSDFIMNGNYTIGDKGKLIGVSSEDGEVLIHEVSFSGTVPSEGSILIENNVVKGACLVIDEYKIELQDGKFTTSGKGECGSEPKVVFGGKVVTGEELEALVGGYTGVKAIVYLDPTNLAAECNESNADSTRGANNTCMKWYAIDALSDDTTYTMILDHNITSVEWVSQDDYEQTNDKTATPESVGISYDNDDVEMTEDGSLPAGVWGYSTYGSIYIPNNRGPITLLNRLKLDTKDWVVAETLTSSDTYTAEWTCTASGTLDQNTYCDDYYTGVQQYTINYSGYKARLISGDEINKITEKGTTTASTIVGGYLDDNCISYNCGKGTSKYAWLLDNTGANAPVGATDAPSCEISGCNVGVGSDPNGYWTSSPTAYQSYSAWNNSGMTSTLSQYPVNEASLYGVRPVITVLKEKLKKDDNL